MSDASRTVGSNGHAITLIAKRSMRGKYPVTLQSGSDVLMSGRVDPHNPSDVDNFTKRFKKQFPALKDSAEDLKKELLQLAAPKSPVSLSARMAAAGNHPYVTDATGTYRTKMIGENEILEPVANFTAEIVANVTRDDGTETETAFEIKMTQGGRALTITVSAAKFSAMNWPIESGGAGFITTAGQGARDNLRAAIQYLSADPKHKTVICHTGWRRFEAGNDGNDGFFGYIHAAGAIGEKGPVDGVQVELSGHIAGYSLPDSPRGSAEVEAVRSSLAVLNLANDSIIFPVVCAIWRSVLGTSDFALHLAGPTGTFKSEVAALAQQHFGKEMDSRHLIGWHSTDNALEGMAFQAKDSLLIVDDFAPAGSSHDVARWHQKADRLFRAQGNNAGRSRMRADGSLRPNKPPRGTIISTGEEIPAGQSIRARTLIVEIATGDVDTTELSRCQRDAREGNYASATSGYLRWLAGRYQQITNGLRSEIDDLRMVAAGSDMHRRTPDIVANLAIGFRHFLDYAKATGAITESERSSLWDRCWSALGGAADKQAIHHSANEPTRRFLELISSAIASGNAHLAGPDGNAPASPASCGWRKKVVGTGVYEKEEWTAQGDRIGWIDATDVLLDPDASYRSAQGMASGGSNGLTISAQTLRKRLDEKGLLIRAAGSDELTVRRVLEGVKRRVINILAGAISLGKPGISDISVPDAVLDHENAKSGPDSRTGFSDGPKKPGTETRHLSAVGISKTQVVPGMTGIPDSPDRGESPDLLTPPSDEAVDEYSRIEREAMQEVGM